MQNTPLTTLKYSAFLGGLYASDPATEAKINEAKVAVGGETVVKRGFTGYDGDGPSATAIKFLAEAGIKSQKMVGPLSAVRIVEKTVNGMKQSYLNVTLGTSAGKTFLSIDVGNKAAQDLIRRLTDAIPGVETEISLYAKYGMREGATRAFADHFASAKQDGQFLKGTNPKDMWPLIRQRQEALKAAGMDDRQILATAEKKAMTEWHLALMPAIAAKFQSHYEQRQQSAPTEAAPVSADLPVAAAAPAVEDDDPFGLNEPEAPVPPPVVAARPAPLVADPFAF